MCNLDEVQTPMRGLGSEHQGPGRPQRAGPGSARPKGRPGPKGWALWALGQKDRLFGAGPKGLGSLGPRPQMGAAQRAQPLGQAQGLGWALWAGPKGASPLGLGQRSEHGTRRRMGQSARHDARRSKHPRIRARPTRHDRHAALKPLPCVQKLPSPARCAYLGGVAHGKSAVL